MHESAFCFHQVEWPTPEATVAGPIAWLRGWVQGKAGFAFVDVRVVAPNGIHLGILGLPRADLAAHFQSTRAWLPSGFVVGVPVADGPASLALEAMDETGQWHTLQTLRLTVAPGGETSSRVEGEMSPRRGGSVTTRGPHQPLHGHLDDQTDRAPGRAGRIDLFGWLLHGTQAVRSVFGTLDGLVFNTLESGLTDGTLAAKVPHHAGARQARFKGGIDAPPTLSQPSCLRVYAELADGSVQLSFARRIEWDARTTSQTGVTTNAAPTQPASPVKNLPVLPSGRPRRLLMVVRSMQPDDATWRALDAMRHLIGSAQWAVRLIASEDGPLRAEFEASGGAVQLVDPREYFAAISPGAAETARQKLGREIWWRYLDAVAVFDPASTWASPLARERGIPVFTDPAETVVWSAPQALFQRDEQGSVLALIRGLAIHGAGVLLHAADQLTRHHAAALAGRMIMIDDRRDTTEERLFQRDADQGELAATFHQLTTERASVGRAVAAVICPVFAEHPHRALLSALAAGVPLITTPSAILQETFGPNEVSYIPAGNPLALAHALVDVFANPEATTRRLAAAARLVSVTHAPARQLPRWQALLESLVAS